MRLAAGKAKDDLRGQRLVAVADHRRDAFEASQFFGGTLRIATGHDDARRRVEAVGTVDESPRGPVGFGGYAAGVDDDNFGSRGSLVA